MKSEVPRLSRSVRWNAATPRSLDVGCALHLHHLVGSGDGAARRARRRLFQFIDHVHSRDDFADHRILAVEAWSVAEHERHLPKLAANAIPSARHAHDTLAG